MIFSFRTMITATALMVGALTSYSVLAQDYEKYDRLDGKGDSGKRVDVIEWEGNLEVHVYPKSSAKGLSAKLDDRTEGKKVMVFGYRFSSDPKAHPLVRRAITALPFSQKFNAYQDPTEKEFDKLTVTPNTLGKPWVPYKLDPAPAQWYPDGDERNEQSPGPILGKTEQPADNRAPASVSKPTTKAVPHEEGDVSNFNF